MDLRVDSYFKKFAPLYISQGLEKYMDENYTLTYEEFGERDENGKKSKLVVVFGWS